MQAVQGGAAWSHRGFLHVRPSSTISAMRPSKTHGKNHAQAPASQPATHT